MRVGGCRAFEIGEPADQGSRLVSGLAIRTRTRRGGVFAVSVGRGEGAASASRAECGRSPKLPANKGELPLHPTTPTATIRTYVRTS